jgi:hypothetical protein
MRHRSLTVVLVVAVAAVIQTPSAQDLRVALVGLISTPVQDRPGAGPTGASPAPLMTVPLDAFGGLPLVQARVNGGPERWFILDTASSFCILDRKEAASVGLKGTGGRPITGGGDRVARIEFVSGVEMEVHGLRFGPLRVGIMETSFRFDRAIAGLVGVPLLREYVIGLDLGRQMLTAWKPDSFRYGGRGTIVPFVLSDDIPKIDVGIRMPGGSRVTADLLVDTGASQSIILNRPFLEAHALDRSPGARVLRHAGSLTGGTSYELARAKAVTLGAAAFHDVLIGFSRDRVGSGSRTDRAGTLGNGLLRNFYMIVDYGRRRLILESTGRPVVPFDYEVTGMVLAAAPCGALVKDVVDGSVAGVAGVRAGDCLERLDDRPLARRPLDDIKAHFKHDGRVMRLGVRRDGKLLSLELRMLAVGI